MWGKGEFNVEFTRDFVKGLLFSTKGETAVNVSHMNLKDFSSLAVSMESEN